MEYKTYGFNSDCVSTPSITGFKAVYEMSSPPPASLLSHSSLVLVQLCLTCRSSRMCHSLTFCVFSGASAGARLDNDKLYRYSYSAEVGLNRPTGSTRGNAGFRISSDVDISLVWRNSEIKDEQLLQVQVKRRKYFIDTFAYPCEIEVCLNVLKVHL